MFKSDASKLWKQRLVRVHGALGLIVSLIMYCALFFGIFAIFLPYLQVWEKPSRHIAPLALEKIDYEKILSYVWQDALFPKNNVIVTFPGTKNENALKVSHRFSAPIFFDTQTANVIQDEGKQSFLAGFLNQLHYGKVLDFDKELFGAAWSITGRVLFGLASVGVLSVIVSGVILIVIFSYQKRAKTPQAFFVQRHISILKWSFPVVFLVTLSGAFMNLSLISSTWMAQLVSQGKESRIDAIIGPVLFVPEKPVKLLNENATMLPIATLVEKARRIVPSVTLHQARLINWNDQSAQIEFKGYDATKPFLNGGVFNKPSITLSAVDGTLLAKQDVMDRSWSVYLIEATFFLHFLAGVDLLSRSLVAFIMALSALAVGFGILSWLEKQAKKFDERITFYHWLGKFSLCITLGVIPATGMLFALQWLLPFDLSDRLLWQKGLFYDAWLATLFWAFYRFNAYRAAKEFLLAGGILFIVSVFLHWFKMGIFVPSVILGVDLALLALGSVLILIALRLPKDSQTARLFWIRKEEKR